MKQGNEQALRLIIERYKSLVYQIIVNVVRDEKEAEDLAQETFLKMMDALPSYQSKGFKTWLGRIAMHKAIDARRKRQRRQEMLEQDGISFNDTLGAKSAEEEWLNREKSAAVASSIQQLPASYQEVVQAYYIEGKTYAEIATEHDLEAKTVEVRLYRARKWMKQHWKKEEFS
ncbi:RNA polymerase sigma factor [Pontibacillus salicampi]|uniref:RNA polymerase sigma factor n=1 Tax=Pontibacillus salicampi TaxID=1449801 RepID=A0ABV6LMD7_9BACI